MGLFDFFKKPDSSVVCPCNKISEKTVIEAIKNGADTFEKVQLATTAGTGRCGGKRCQAKIEKLIAANK